MGLEVVQQLLSCAFCSFAKYAALKVETKIVDVVKDVCLVLGL